MSRGEIRAAIKLLMAAYARDDWHETRRLLQRLQEHVGLKAAIRFRRAALRLMGLGY